MKMPPGQPRVALICAALAVLTLVLFWPITTHDFVNYDDPLYVTENARVKTGISMENTIWAFDRVVGNQTYWHPVTWLSHQLDCELFGLRAGSHHLISLLLHAGNVVGLFLLLHRLTGHLWRSAFVAALFAWHPLQVDTVAWVAERKTILGTLFGLLTIWAYARYVEAKRSPERRRSLPWFGCAVLLFGVALMSKGPLLVTLPCVLLLLDIWPLRRLGNAVDGVTATPFSRADLLPLARLMLEKIPFFVLTIISSVITLTAHQRLNLVISTETLPVGERLMNGFVAYVRYLGKVFWPADLAVYYPPETTAPMIQWGAVVLVAVISLLAFRFAKKYGGVFVGWFWFVGMLVPFVGFVQAGVQSMADRFVYMPIAGCFIAISWILAELRRTRAGNVLGSSIATVVLMACFVTARHQAGHWKNTETLFGHAVAVTKPNVIVRINYGSALAARGDLAGAARQYGAAIEINPGELQAYELLARILERSGDAAGARETLNAALVVQPNSATAHNDLGVLLMKEGQLDEAADEFALATKLNPDFPEAFYNAGVAASQQKKNDAATAHYLRALQLRPDYFDARNNLAATLADMERYQEAADQLQEVIAARPNEAEAHFNLSYVLRKLGQADRAQEHYELARRLKPDLFRK